MRGEVLRLVGLVLLVDAVFLGLFFAAGLDSASANLKLGFAIVWTVANVAAVVVGLNRVKAARSPRGR
ncbi:MAG: hypothetical protein H0T44_04765 [Gemmatimonadales bacterium]|nr:hypothetical protein [Gemmatimonadales bacterium]